VGIRGDGRVSEEHASSSTDFSFLEGEVARDELRDPAGFFGSIRALRKKSSTPDGSQDNEMERCELTRTAAFQSRCDTPNESPPPGAPNTLSSSSSAVSPPCSASRTKGSSTRGRTEGLRPRMVIPDSPPDSDVYPRSSSMSDVVGEESVGEGSAGVFGMELRCGASFLNRPRAPTSLEEAP